MNISSSALVPNPSLFALPDEIVGEISCHVEETFYGWVTTCKRIYDIIKKNPDLLYRFEKCCSGISFLSQAIREMTAMPVASTAPLLPSIIKVSSLVSFRAFALINGEDQIQEWELAAYQVSKFYPCATLNAILQTENHNLQTLRFACLWKTCLQADDPEQDRWMRAFSVHLRRDYDPHDHISQKVLEELVQIAEIQPERVLEKVYFFLLPGFKAHFLFAGAKALMEQKKNFQANQVIKQAVLVEGISNQEVKKNLFREILNWCWSKFLPEKEDEERFSSYCSTPQCISSLPVLGNKIEKEQWDQQAQAYYQRDIVKCCVSES